MSVRGLLTLCVAALALSSCVIPVAEEPRYSKETLATIEIGRTTKAEVVSALGEPDWRKEEAGKSVFYYWWPRSFGAAIILVAPGPVKGGSKTVTAFSRFYLFKAWFNEQGIVENAEQREFQDESDFTEMLAKEGNAEVAFSYAGQLYSENNYGGAAKFYCFAAREGHAGAQYYLARLYAGTLERTPGDGLTDNAKAYAWYSLAATHGYDVKQELATLAHKMTPSQAADAETLIENWRTASCGPPLLH